ncbi:MAG: capsule assembly Wzi family protein [Ignavibacteria bacterium]|nr:capsule assembly Wzi family protein [Ignavibacteria bacterium]
MKKILLFILLCANISFAQMEYTPVDHPVYDFLKRMSLKNVISGYNSGALPISRNKISKYIIEISNHKDALTSTDRKILNDYQVEYSYEIKKSLNDTYSFFSDVKSFSVLRDDKQKYLYAFADSNATLFWDVTGFLSQKGSKADSLGNNSITLGEIGTRIRGTMLGSVGYYLRMSNGQKIRGAQKDVDFAIALNPKLKANTKFRYEGNNFDTYEGYLKYSTPNEWFSLIAGKEAMTYGFGYVDKLFLSTNTVPFSSIRLELAYKSVQYSFMYGSLKGDSLGVDMQSKSIATHRLDVDISKAFRFGFWETIIISDSYFNFTYLNPLSFLRSADYNAGENHPTNNNNALMGFDCEVHPIKNVSLQSSLLIDDLNFATLFKNRKGDTPANDNRFAYQLGILWTDAFSIPNLTATLEYTKLSPFIYTHRTNKSQYTNWTLPLGHKLPPNSDEIAFKLSTNIYNRLKVDLTLQHQRSANRIIMSGDTLIANYGGNINRGDGDIVRDNLFLEGDRVDRDIAILGVVWQPVRQFFIDLSYQFIYYNLLYNSTKYKDNYFSGTIRVDF